MSVKPGKEKTIFVSIASYRDDVCIDTLQSLFDNANNPSKIFVGICQQNKKDEDKDCEISNYNCNVRTITLPHYESKGPTWARYLCSTLWNGEEYFLQIDSHTKFVKDWDIKCIKMVNDIVESGRSFKPIISSYPENLKIMIITKRLIDLKFQECVNPFGIIEVCYLSWVLKREIQIMRRIKRRILRVDLYFAVQIF